MKGGSLREGHFLAYNCNTGRSGKGEMRLSTHLCSIEVAVALTHLEGLGAAPWC